jgi:monoamine oxidase
VSEAEVIIVGAGVSGLAAARLLTRFGVSCLVVEASARIGGRLHTVRRPGWTLPIELGAEFVHGRPATTLALGGGAVHLVHVPEQRMRGGDSPRPMQRTWQRFAELMQPATSAPEHESVGDFLERADLAPEDRELVQLMVEGYHAAPCSDVSARVVAADAQSSAVDFEQYRSSVGYDTVLAELEHDLSQRPCRIQLLTRVRRVDWSRGHVRLSAEASGAPCELHARACVVTTSIGVLASAPNEGGIDFRPLPPAFREALPLLGMGHVSRVVLRFHDGPWLSAHAGHEVSFVHAPEEPFQTFWREARAGQEQITAWAGGPRALELAALDDTALYDTALRALSRAVGAEYERCRSALLEAHHHDFERDPFTRGAYSYVRPGGEHAAKALAAPCEGTLYFAGEALDSQYPATIAGALGSGEHAARQLLAARG